MENKTSKDVVLRSRSRAELKAESKERQKKEQRQSKRADFAKFALAAILVALGIWAFYALDTLSIYVRYLFPAVGVILAIAIVFLWSSVGRDLVAYVKDSVVEAKKVVWPERSEAIRMTLFVLAFAAIMSLFIWGVDSVISWLFFDVLIKRG